MQGFKVKDHYYKKAKKGKFLARSIFKLEEIDKKFDLIRPGMRVLDLGYYPGSWVQYTSKAVGSDGLVLGIDLAPVNEELSALKNIKLLEKDIFDVSPKELGKFDLILSDMAPKTSGIKSLDQDRSLVLVEQVFSLVPELLKPQGHLVVKVFESQNAQNFLKENGKSFAKINYLRPKATRSVSKEFFAIAKDYKVVAKSDGQGY